MAVHKYYAPLLFLGDGKCYHNAVVICDETGQILSIDQVADHDPTSINNMEGALMPGMVNAHCHLELSHMKGLVDTGTTLLPFLKSVVQFRDFPETATPRSLKRSLATSNPSASRSPSPSPSAKVPMANPSTCWCVGKGA